MDFRVVGNSVIASSKDTRSLPAVKVAIWLYSFSTAHVAIHPHESFNYFV